MRELVGLVHICTPGMFSWHPDIWFSLFFFFLFCFLSTHFLPEFFTPRTPSPANTYFSSSLPTPFTRSPPLGSSLLFSFLTPVSSIQQALVSAERLRSSGTKETNKTGSLSSSPLSRGTCGLLSALCSPLQLSITPSRQRFPPGFSTVVTAKLWFRKQ